MDGNQKQVIRTERLQLALQGLLKRKHGSPTKRLKRLRKKYPTLSPQSLGVVSCYFNPTRSRRRTENVNSYMAKIRKSKVSFCMVELAFNDRPFELSGEGILHLRTDDVLWHKERLLNIGIARMLEQGCEQIAWLDSDIEFDDPHWAWHITKQLEESKLCQVFRHARMIKSELGDKRPVLSSIRHHQIMGGDSLLKYQPPVSSTFLRPFGVPRGHPGFGWAARAEVLRETPLYDRAIVGGGDRLLLCATFYRQPFASDVESQLDATIENPDGLAVKRRPKRFTAHYLEWAKRWFEAIGGSVGDVDLHIQDMYHGSHANRLYGERRKILVRNDYDPVADVNYDSNGLLTWANDKSTLHREVKDYFESRCEDL